MARGTVAEFDEDRGLGTIDSEGRRFPFHCTQITDGTRTIPVGTAVTFDVVPGHLGTWEAVSITPA